MTYLCASLAESAFELQGRVCIGDPDEAQRLLAEFPDDEIAFEAFVNHLHLPEVLPDALRDDRRAGMLLGRTLITIWAERLRPVLRGRPALFFLGGRKPEDITLRFHVERESQPAWVDITDGVFLKRERLEVYRESGDQLVRVA